MKIVSNPPTDGTPLRLVLDTQIWLDLLLFDDPRCAALGAALLGGRAIAHTDDECSAEWRRVLRYPALRLTPEQREELQSRFDALAVPFEGSRDAPAQVPLPRCRDPDDQKFLQLARDTQAVALVSRDNAVLELARQVERSGLFRILRPEEIGWH